MIKKGSHLNGVEPINEKIITNDNFFNILINKGIDNKIIDYLRKLINNRDLYDKSGYSGNSVLLVKSDNMNTKSFVIKISNDGHLYDEYIAYKFFYKIGYTAKPINYFKCGVYQIIITELILDSTAGYYFNSYEDISLFFGKELKKFHERKLNEIEFTKEEKELFESKYEKNLAKALKNNIPLIYMVNYMGDCNVTKMKKYLIEHKEYLHKNLVLVHGDFNPNNVFVDKNKKIKFIDFCDTGICNKHYDIFWTMFMIIVFSGILYDKEKTKKCESIFLSAYGKESINQEELLFFKYYSTLYWKQHDEITRIDIL